MEAVLCLSRLVIKYPAVIGVDSVHTFMFLGNALVIAQVAMSPSALGKDSRDPFRDEMQRRRLWACYLMTSYSSETHLQKWAFQFVKGLGLPCREDEFYPGMASPVLPVSIERPNVGVVGHLIGIICLWQVGSKIMHIQPN